MWRQRRGKAPHLVVGLVCCYLVQAATSASLLNGVLYAWGSGDALGEPADADGNPVEVANLDNAVARIAAGKDHSVVLRSSGMVYTFGSGSYGQLGHGDRVARSAPTRVASSLIGSNVALVSAGTHFTIVVKLDISNTQFLSSEGGPAWQLYAWGVNDWGQLGIGSYSNAVYDMPRLVSSLSTVALSHEEHSVGDVSVAELVSGARHTVAVMRDGRAFGWGANQYGALGRICTAPQTAASAGCVVVRPQVLSVGDVRVARAALGLDYSVLLSRDGTLWSTGRNSAGQLGLGDHASDRFAFESVRVPGQPQILQIATGRQHTLAVSAYGQIWAWGCNEYGQLGLGVDYGAIESTPTVVAMHTIEPSVYELTDPAMDAWNALFLSFASDAQSIQGMRVAAGDGFSVFVVDGGHTVVGVGRSDSGQLGASCSYPILMSINPRRSRCPPSVISGGWQSDADSNCVDLDPTCAMLEDAGNCAATSNMFGYMANNCRLTCKLCSLAPPVADLAAGPEGHHVLSLLGGGCGSDFTGHLGEGAASCTCKKCVDGTTFTSSTLSCTPCEAGRFGVADRCPVWCREWRKETMCTEYKALYFDDSSNCAACAAGRASDRTGQVGEVWCEECHRGRYSIVDGSTECSTCGSGQFSEALASTTCRSCVAGRWAGPGSIACTLCPAGRSSARVAAENSDSCIECAAGTEALPGSVACTACAVGWADVDRQPASLCVQCGPGRFSPANSTECTACAEGRADLDFDAATECTFCMSGSYSLINSTSCIHCLPGFSDDDMDPATVCFQCRQGFYTSLISSTGGCVYCAIGQSTVALGAVVCEDCPRGRTDDDLSAKTQCTNCSVGQYSAGGMDTCHDCGEGVLDDDLDPSTPCATCSAGRFESIVAFIPSCVDCSAGRYSSVVAASSASVCEPCDRGFADVDLEPATPCSSCEPGKYASKLASTVCTGCTAGTYSEAMEATSNTTCIACAPGFSSLIEAASSEDACVPCPRGQYYGQASEISAFVCVNCTHGRFSTELGAQDDTACLACAAGTASTEGATFCVNCPSGSYAPTGSENCQTCPQGQMAIKSIAATECVNCQAGRFATVASTECRVCVPGRFAAPGQGTCGECAPGSYVEAVAAPECSLCEDGYASSMSGATTRDVCLPCQPGFFADGRVVCTGCEKGTHSLVLAMGCEKCEVREACIGNGECLTGYTSDFCSSCETRFFKMNSRCHRCPDNSMLLIVLAIIIFLLVAMLVLKLGNNSRKTSSIQAYGKSSVSSRVSVPISVLWTELQFNLAFFDLDLQWPSFLLDATQFLKTILDFDFAAMTAPECAVQFSSPGQAAFARMVIVASGLPVFCIAICLLYVAFNSLIAIQSQRVWQAFVHLFMAVPRETANACVIGFTLQYVMLTRTAAEAFDCRPLDRDGTPWRLDSQREVRCTFGANSWWPKILIIGGTLAFQSDFRTRSTILELFLSHSS